MISSSERDLLENARKLDLATLGAIYDKFSPGIYRYAMRLLGDETLAEDCVADTFSRFLHALNTGAGPRDHLQAYLYRIAHNWITDNYRRQAPILLELDESIKSDEMNLPEKMFEDHIARQQIRIALRCLTPEQMQVISLRFIEDWDMEEIAAAMQKQVGAVKALQHRALESLRRILLRKEMADHETSRK
ncbi:MAG: RNA polymerase sigma factor [Anaerolineaceae bacterium]